MTLIVSGGALNSTH